MDSLRTPSAAGNARHRVVPARYWLVLSLFLLSMLLYVDRVCISSAQGDIETDLKLSERQMGWILSAFALGYALFQVPSGLLADRFGPRIILSAVVTFWSVFTALTGAARGFGSMLLCRFFFGAGEAGAFPGCARAVYSWIPPSERGLVQGVMFSGSRVGAAFALPVVAWMVGRLGWRASFVVLGAVGVAWAAFWFRWFRDDPEWHPRTSESEKDLIRRTHPQQSLTVGADEAALNAGRLLGSRNVWLLMGQYFCSNFTFFFCLTWLFPYLQDRFRLDMVQAGLYAAGPPLAGALGNWTSGFLVDVIYRKGRWALSRRAPAVMGFILAAGGLIGSQYVHSAPGAVALLALAVFGADMTLAPSWSVCIDIGRRHSGTVSGTMNMAGNLGSFLTALAFPYLLAWTGSHTAFFVVGAMLNGAAAVAWLRVWPDRRLEDY